MPARVFRISFTGELGYEIQVPAGYGLAALASAASRPASATASRPTAPRRCTCCAPRRATSSPARTPTARSRRPISAWTGSSRSRSPTSSANARSRAPTSERAGRKQLVGLLPEPADELLEEGAQIVADPHQAVPMTMIGHVTSSYRSPSLGRCFALALVADGRARIGHKLYVPLIDRTVAVTVTEPLFLDPEGSPPPCLSASPAHRRRRARSCAARHPPRRTRPLGKIDLRGSPARARLHERRRPRARPAAADRAHRLGEQEPGQRALARPRPVAADLPAGRHAASSSAACARRSSGSHHALTDVSDGLVTFTLAGPSARDVLAKGCPLDLHPRAFTPGSCARSLLAKADVLLHLHADEARRAFDLHVAPLLRAVPLDLARGRRPRIRRAGHRLKPASLAELVSGDIDVRHICRSGSWYVLRFISPRSRIAASRAWRRAAAVARAS